MKEVAKIIKQRYRDPAGRTLYFRIRKTDRKEVGEYEKMNLMQTAERSRSKTIQARRARMEKTLTFGRPIRPDAYWCISVDDAVDVMLKDTNMAHFRAKIWRAESGSVKSLIIKQPQGAAQGSASSKIVANCATYHDDKRLRALFEKVCKEVQLASGYPGGAIRWMAERYEDDKCVIYQPNESLTKLSGKLVGENVYNRRGDVDLRFETTYNGQPPIGNKPVEHLGLWLRTLDNGKVISQYKCPLRDSMIPGWAYQRKQQKVGMIIGSLNSITAMSNLESTRRGINLLSMTDMTMKMISIGYEERITRTAFKKFGIKYWYIKKMIEYMRKNKSYREKLEEACLIDVEDSCRYPE